ncbi:hypothetical protein NLB96_00555 [Candidatus Aminicenantes bacterium AC-335-K20]|nr:hypothetical protein [SCandidatus Aminicenantes bacterium Aminicenantia_JdfR_composite]MCP2605453.1 hypothetical protein [Candidatus Aminicenantes bacterium AC-335-O07]MCP2619246.1 hypothetical protein [Candidatus Aminicenantes bacterium AC-335-K20]
MFLIGIAYAIGLIRSYPQQKSLAPIFFLNHLIGLILVVSMTFLISTKRRIVILSYAYLASGIIPLLLGGYQLMYWFFHHDVPILPFSNFIYLPKLAQIYARVSADISLPRVIGSFTDPNFFGYFLTSIILISLSLFFYYKQKKRKFAIKIVLLLYIFVSFFGLLFTFSRSSLFGLGIGGLVLTRLHRNITTSLFMKYAFFGCFFIILFLSLVNVGLFDKGIIKYSDFLHARLSTGLFDRIERARNGVRAFLNQPILGIGLANFEFEYGYRRDASTTHIFYLTILSELGLMGFFPVTTFLILISIQSIRKISNPQIPDHLSALGSGLLSSLLALMAANLYYDNLFGIESFWVLIGLVTVYGYVRLPRRD